MSNLKTVNGPFILIEVKGTPNAELKLVRYTGSKINKRSYYRYEENFYLSTDTYCITITDVVNISDTRVVFKSKSLKVCKKKYQELIVAIDNGNLTFNRQDYSEWVKSYKEKLDKLRVV